MYNALTKIEIFQLLKNQNLLGALNVGLQTKKNNKKVAEKTKRVKVAKKTVPKNSLEALVAEMKSITSAGREDLILKRKANPNYKNMTRENAMHSLSVDKSILKTWGASALAFIDVKIKNEMAKPAHQDGGLIEHMLQEEYDTLVVRLRNERKVYTAMMRGLVNRPEEVKKVNNDKDLKKLQHTRKQANQRKKVQCCCGAIVSNDSLARHKRTEKHKVFSNLPLRIGIE